MHSKINFLLLEYAINAMLRRGAKNLFIFAIFSLLVFLLSSVLLISDSIKLELYRHVQSLPEITLQRFIAGKQTDVPLSRIEALLGIEGVERVTPRVWGYYYFQSAGVNFSVMGIDVFETQYKEPLQKIVNTLDFTLLAKSDGMIVGEGVKKILQEHYYEDFFNFITSEGKWKRMQIAGVVTPELSLHANDMILLPIASAYEILGVDKTMATDIVVHVSNPKEIPTIVSKINRLYPDTRSLTQEDIKVSYQNIFDYKSGFFLSLFVVSAFTFFIIIFDKTSGLNAEEKREIGILKALGWSIDDILKAKFYEGFILSFCAFILGLCVALFFVYFWQAPLLRDVFLGYAKLKPTFALPFSINVEVLFLLFLLSVPVYIGATLIPSWRASTLEADEVMR